ncbi:hypothetical protein DPMN_118039 [Dreissena polymorpha]|uniref:Uncharacterized protein n=1 Tax=Dreissena polymorpha TaxID=45954 RepID=A0A9D4GGM7_DREPO|nr:hypothetical protein DPMN_118039 [Dreissena polymorpha]
MPLPWWPCFKATKTIFKLIQYIIGTNLLTKFHDDRKINVTSRVLTRFYYFNIMKNAPPPWRQCFSTNHIIGMNFLTEFHEDWTINVASTMKYAPPLGSHVFQANVTILELIQDINKTNLLTKFHENWKINVAPRVLTWKNALPLGSQVFQAKVTIFELIQDIIGTNLLTKLHEGWKINVASTVLTRKNAPPPRRPYIHGMNLLTKKNALPLGSHVFQANIIIFEIIQDIIETNLLTKFYED